MEERDFEVGQYLFSVRQRLIGRDYEIRREVVQKWDRGADRYQLGDSKMPSSWNTSGFISRGGLGFYGETPAEAVALFVTASVKSSQELIEKAESDIKQLKAEIKTLLKMDHTKLKVQSYPDDYKPCDI